MKKKRIIMIVVANFSLSEEEMQQIRALDSEDRYYNLPYDQMGI